MSSNTLSKLKSSRRPLSVPLKYRQILKTNYKALASRRVPAKLVAGPFYSYIFDVFLKNKKYEKIIQAIENRLMDLGMNGRTHRLSQLKNIRDCIKDDIKCGVKTIVIIGTDETIIAAINAVAEEEITLGIIPLGPASNLNIAKILGIGEGLAACDTLSRRLIQKLDLGKVNGRYFLLSLFTSAKYLTLKCDDKYTITPLIQEQTAIFNLPFPLPENIILKKNPNPSDGILETVIFPKDSFWDRIFKKEGQEKHKASVFFNKKIILESEKQFPIYADGEKMVQQTFKIEICPKKLKVIVGKNRTI